MASSNFSLRFSKAPRIVLAVTIATLGLLAMVSCSKKESAPNTAEQAKSTAGPEAAKAPAAPVEAASLIPTEAAAQAEGNGALQLPLNLRRRTDDLDVMLRGRTIRALVFINPIGFFYDKGRPHGINYEALEELEKFVNQKYKTGTLKVKIVFIPIRPNQAEKAITEGLGDVLAQGIAITPRASRASLSLHPSRKT